MFYRSGTIIWREGLLRLRNVSTNSYWHERLTVFFSCNLFSPLTTSYIFLQATFFSFTIYHLCSPHLVLSFYFQLNFTQNKQIVTFLLIVDCFFTTKNDPFLSKFHNVQMQIKNRMIFDFALLCSVMCSAVFETLFCHRCVFLFHRWFYLTLVMQRYIKEVIC